MGSSEVRVVLLSWWACWPCTYNDNDDDDDDDDDDDVLLHVDGYSGVMESCWFCTYDMMEPMPYSVYCVLSVIELIIKCFLLVSSGGSVVVHCHFACCWPYCYPAIHSYFSFIATTISCC